MGGRGLGRVAAGMRGPKEGRVETGAFLVFGDVSASIICIMISGIIPSLLSYSSNMTGISTLVSSYIYSFNCIPSRSTAQMQCRSPYS